MLEAASIPTAVLSWIPELTQSVGAPRVIGIGHPGSIPFGQPGDHEGQREVLGAALKAAMAVNEPGGRIDVPFELPPGTRVPKPPRPPPITRAIMKRPWLYLRLLRGELPSR